MISFLKPRYVFYTIHGFFSYLYYCNLVWGSTYKNNLKRLTITQKRATRVVRKSGCNADTDPIFIELAVVKMNSIHLLQLVGQFMFSFSAGNLPPELDSFFSVNNSIHMIVKHKARFLV